MLARERLALQAISGATPAADALQFLSGLQLAAAPSFGEFRRHYALPPSASSARSLLASAGSGRSGRERARASAPKPTASRRFLPWNWPNWPTGATPPIRPSGTSSTSPPATCRFRSITHPTNSGAWHFRLPYRHSLEEYSRQQSLDPFLVAALIRQESEFNTNAVSRANARGLTQVIPSTGAPAQPAAQDPALYHQHAVQSGHESEDRHLLSEGSCPISCRANGNRRWRPTMRANRGSIPGPTLATSTSRLSLSRASRSAKPACTSRVCCATPKCIVGCTAQRRAKSRNVPA